MNIAEPFIKRPIATTLLTIALALAGVLAFGLLPVAPLPQVDFPTIQVSAALPGVGQVMVGGGALPAVRFELNPLALNKYRVGLEDVRSALAASNLNRPKGQLADGRRASELQANDQLFKADEYAPLIVAYQNG